MKKQAEHICSELGMSLSTATTLFYKKMINYGGIPFELKVDSFYSKENQEHLDKVVSNYYSDKTQPLFKELDELEAIEE